MNVFAAFDPQAIVDWILGHLGPIFVAVVFFVLPILRGLKEQAQKKRQLEERRRADLVGEGEPEADGEQGRKAFEALLRGETPSTPPALPVAPPPVLEAPVEPGSRASSLAGPLSDLASAPTEDEVEGSFDEERAALEGNERLLREERRRRTDFLAQERESAARKSVAPEGLLSLQAYEVEAAPAPLSSGRALLAWKGADRRTLLRRAIVAREVLGPPLSVRADTDALGPTALTR